MGKFKDQFIGLAVGAVMLVASGGTIGWQQLLQAAVVSYGVAESRRQARKQAAAAGAYSSLRQDRMITTTSTLMPRRYVVGRTIVGGNLTFIGTSGNNQQYLHVVLTLCDACSSIDDVLFDGESIGALDNYGMVQAGSKYFKSASSQSTLRVGHPGSGRTVLIPGASIRVLSVAFRPYVTPRVAEYETPQSSLGPTEYLNVDVDYRASQTANGLSVAFLSERGYPGAVTITYVSTTGTPLVRCYRYNGFGGAPYLRDPTLEADFPGQWTASHIGNGVARLHLRLQYDPDVFTGGLPEITALVSGVPIVDVRTGQSKLGMSLSTAVIYDYLMHEYGFRARNTDFDVQQLIADLNVCDSPSTWRGAVGEARYTINGVIHADEAPLPQLRSLLSASLGTVIWQSGVWRIRAAQYIAPVMTLTADDLVDGPIAISSRQERSDVFNQVRGSYINRDKGYTDDSYPDYRAQVYVDEDRGNEFVGQLDLPYTQSALTAQRLAKLHLLKSRQATRLTARFGLVAARLEVSDTVWLSLEYAGWENKVFRVTSKSLDIETMSVELSLQEDAPQVYDENFDEATNPDPSPNTTLPDPRYVPPIEGFTATTSPTSYSVLPDGTISGYIECKWSPVTSSSVLRGGHVEIWWKDALDTTYRRERIEPDVSEYVLKPVVPRQRVNLYAYNVNGSGVQSARIDLTVDVNGSIPSNKIGAVLNQNVLANAAFAAGGAGWRLDVGAAANAGMVSLIRDAATSVAQPLPTTLLMYQFGATSAPNFISSIGSVRVDAGTRWCMQVEVYSPNASAWAVIDFYDQAGGRVGYATTAASPVTAGTPDQFRSYRLVKFFDVPDGTAYMRYAIVRSGAFTQTPGDPGNTTTSSFTRPMLSLASPDQTEPPEWSDGPPMVPQRWVEEISDAVVTNPSPGGEIGRYSVPLIKGQRVASSMSATISGVRSGPSGGIVTAAVDAQFLWRDGTAWNIGVSMYQDAVAPGVSFSLGGGNHTEFEVPESGDAVLRVTGRGTAVATNMRVSHVSIMLEIL